MRCSALTAAGDQCQRKAAVGQRTCWLHDPAHAEQRSAASAKAGRSRSGGEIPEIKAELRQLARDVRSGSCERGVGSVVSQVLGVLVKYLELERRIKIEEEFESRLELLEKERGLR